jgi:hypothetical protein
LAAELDREKQLPLTRLDLPFEGKLPLFAVFQGCVERPPLGHELVQLEGHGPIAALSFQRASNHEEITQVLGALLGIEPGDLGELSGDF